MGLPSSIIQRDTRANQPSAASVAAGTLYFVTDENLLERSSGAAWQTYGALQTAATTYTPTLTSVTNVDSSTAYALQYARTGTTVTVSGQIDVNATDNAFTQLGVSLPVASNFANEFECAGAAIGRNGTGTWGIVGAVIADATNNRAELQFNASYLLTTSFFVTFSYTVI